MFNADYVNEPLFFTELVQFGEKLDCFVILHFKDETIQYYGQDPDGEISVEIVPLMLDGVSVFNLKNNSIWKLSVDRSTKTVLFGSGNIVFDEGPFKYRIESIKNRGLGTYILSRLIEIIQVFLGEYSFDITMGAPFEDNHRLKDWYKRFGFREGLPRYHKGIVKDLKTNFSNKPCKLLYTSVKCQESCGFKKNLEIFERNLNDQLYENKVYKKISELRGQGNNQLLLICIGSLVLSIIFPKISVLGFLLIIINQFLVAWKVNDLRMSRVATRK